MTISFAKPSQPKSGPKSGTLVLTAGEEGALWGEAAAFDKAHNGVLSKAIKATKFDGANGKILDTLAPADLGPARLVVVGLGPVTPKTDLMAAEQAGGRLMAHLLANGHETIAVLADAPEGLDLVGHEWAAHFAMGCILRDYRFDKYKSAPDADQGAGNKGYKLTVMTEDATKARNLFKDLSAVADATKMARDLVSEPPNVLTPKEFAKRCKALTKLGVEVEILTEKEMAKLNMNALLGVGQGSVQDSLLVIMHWRGGSGEPSGGRKGSAKRRSSAQPLAFVGKGVCFDSGGISIKPGPGMEEMKGDMGGAAAVTGLMQALASRKAKVDVLGVVGLVENMPDGNAQRPGDVVKTMSGQTVEIINTDAEGRLVLADALWYTQNRFAPRFMVDVATLTGGIVIALANEYGGLFTDDETLAEQLVTAGQDTGEPLWRMPLGEAYDRMIDSQFADMKNSSGRPGTSITAAQFLRRFTNGIPWAHIDIAGTAWAPKPTDVSPAWATGYGVRLLDAFVARNYEK